MNNLVHWYIFVLHQVSLWLSDAIWQHKSGSTLAQVMACCLTAPSHNLNQCWLPISKVQWHHLRANLQEITRPSIAWISFKITFIQISQGLVFHFIDDLYGVQTFKWSYLNCTSVKPFKVYWFGIYGACQTYWFKDWYRYQYSWAARGAQVSSDFDRAWVEVLPFRGLYWLCVLTWPDTWGRGNIVIHVWIVLMFCDSIMSFSEAECKTVITPVC